MKAAHTQKRRLGRVMLVYQVLLETHRARTRRCCQIQQRSAAHDDADRRKCFMASSAKLWHSQPFLIDNQEKQSVCAGWFIFSQQEKPDMEAEEFILIYGH